MTRQDKAQLISDLTEKFKGTDHFYIADTSGLTVAEINKFREMCFNKGVEYKLVKNTLIKKALENVDGDFSS
ncbi:MAG: 50S ribosomal protein L10, partial [Ekhidna sp.]